MGARRNSISILAKIIHVWKKTSSSTRKGKVLLDDFEGVANGKGKVVLDDTEAVGNGKGGQILDLRLPRSTRMSYKEMTDLLLDKMKDGIWKWFFCKPKCKLEKGLTLVENDTDCEKMFELANFHGYLDVYVGHNPQVILLDWYIKNLEVICESDEEVTSKYRSHKKVRKDSSTMSLEELIAWEQEETQTPSYLRSPHVWKKTSASTSKGKVMLDDFEDVANGKGKVVLDEFADVGNDKGKVMKLIDDVSEADDFKRMPWIMALEFINDNEEIRHECFGDIKSYLKKGKLEKVVAIVTSCKPNVIGDMNVTLKDPSGTMAGTIHHKVLLNDAYAKAIKVRSALILHNVSVFCPKPSIYYLNITIIVRNTKVSVTFIDNYS
ncbi:transposase, MuDR, MULE transposase domain protein [Tanacetum coccineum]